MNPRQKVAPSSAVLARDSPRGRSACSRRGQAQQEGQREQTEEGWWGDASKSEQASWLRAYYAEYGGELKVTYATAQQCISCYGSGSTLEMGPEGRMVRRKCYLCQDTKWVRSFKAY